MEESQVKAALIGVLILCNSVRFKVAIKVGTKAIYEWVSQEKLLELDIVYTERTTQAVLERNGFA